MIKQFNYYTLGEVLEIIEGQPQTPYGIKRIDQILDAYHITYSKIGMSLTSTTIDSLWQEIFNKYRNEFCFKTHILDNNLEEHIKDFFYKLLGILKRTHEYYSTLLDIYSNNKDKLMDDVKTITSSKQRFNDTPQNNGVYDDEAYTTNISINESESSSPMSTIMSRIAEIQQNYMKVLDDWTNEFGRLFMEE